MKCRLLIEGMQADLGPDITDIYILLNRRYDNLTNPTEYYNEWSKTVRLPYSDNNNRLFSELYRADGLVTNLTFDPRKRLSFILLCNEEPVMKGYCKVTQVSYSLGERYYELNLFGTLGQLLNDMKQLTFNRNADVEDKYIIDSPFDVTLDRALVKASFEQVDHSASTDIDSKAPLDWFGFFPSYQGEYPDFSSDRMEVGGVDIELTDTRDEHYMSEYRSYYQQPFLYVDGLWQLVKDAVESMSDYTLDLDGRWFNASNPFYHNLIYTCPTLYDTSTASGSSMLTENYGAMSGQYVSGTTVQGDLSNYHKDILDFTRAGGDELFVSDGKYFDTDADRSSFTFKETCEWTLFAASPTGSYCKIRKDNPLFLQWRAVRKSNNTTIPGATYTMMLYSGSTVVTSGYDIAVDVGVTSRSRPALVTLPSGYSTSDGFFWGGWANVEMTINADEDFYIICNQYAYNNGKPFESALVSWAPRWDWMWTDLFYNGTGKTGLKWFVNCVKASAETRVNIRTNRKVTIFDVFPKNVSIFDVLLNYCKMFGLQWDLDEDSGTLHVLTRRDYFDSYTIEDWTDRLDRTGSYTLKPINWDTKYVTFNYSDGDSARLEYYQGKYALGYGSKRISTEYEFNSDDNELYENLVPAIIASKKQDSFYFNTEYPSKPHFLGFNYKYMPEMYFVDNDNNGNSANISGAFYFRNGCYTVDDTGTPTDDAGRHCVYITDDSSKMIKADSYCWCTTKEFEVPCYNLPAVSTFSADNAYSIHFTTPAEYYFNPSTVGYVGSAKYLYDAFWSDYINERYNVQNKVLNCRMYLSNSDYRNFTHNTFVKVDNVLYMVNAISDFNPLTQDSTAVELVQVYDIDGYTTQDVPYDYLYTDSSDYSIGTQASEIEVHSSTAEFSISSAPSWLTATADGLALNVVASSNPRYTSRRGRIMLTNQAGCTWTLNVVQDAASTSISVDRNVIGFTTDGGTELIYVETIPSPVKVESKPDWVRVREVPSRESQTSSRDDMRNTTIEVVASSWRNRNSRSGTVVLGNGSEDTVEVKVFQIGGMFTSLYDNDVFDREPVHLTSGTTNTLPVALLKEVDADTLKVSNGTIESDRKSGDAIVSVNPSIPAGESSDGGAITVETLDGDLISMPYNTGDLSTRFYVTIRCDSHTNAVITSSGNTDGTVDPGGVWMGSYLSPATVTITATGESGYIFDTWSDSNTSATRTITGETYLTAYSREVQETLLAWDDGQTLAFDNGDQIIAAL